MNIALVPAEKVPALFANRIKHRQVDQAAFVTSMSAEFQNNPIFQGLMKYGLPKDTLALDYFGYWHGVTPTRFMKSSHKEARNHFQNNFQGSFVVMGPPPRINLTNSTILNRSHVKAYVVGNKVLSLGGVNCTTYSYYDFIDIMLDFESDKFIAFLHKLAATGGNLRTGGVGESFWLNEHSEVLIDYGKRNNALGTGVRSVILNSLLNDLAKELLSATLSSTYIPYGKLDNVLFRQLQKGRKITFYTNQPAKFQLPNCAPPERFLQRFYMLKAKTPWVDRRPDKFNHLKAAIIKYPSGDRVAYVGSHNFHELPVWAGTAETCLRTTDDKLIDQLEAFMDENLSGQ